MRGRARTDWSQFHREHIDRWHHRCEYLVVGVIDVAAMHYDNPYMVWYRHITRTLVGNPAHRPTSGYVEIGSTIRLRLTISRPYMIALIVRSMRTIGQSHYRTCTMPVTCVSSHFMYYVSTSGSDS
ncbi:Serine/threonine-protein phosphatase 7 long form like [Actinidia chinensis var. chinensis]|uniref:Serine/threonine-protein phosphatase 7 long form like n=1 Tax=Actinidia chinensis var. chinensis TaxID=1590841 RepID=A0A2R6R222_ACTCC|nr:Serine/threonine-protein phosphatase 7 long form like [Actinidia chinensis var. chinensis]